MSLWKRGSVTGTAALAVPPLKLADLTAAGDPRAEAIWYRTGDNSMEIGDGIGYDILNRYARDAEGRWPDPQLDGYLADIADAMSASRIRRPIVAWRGMQMHHVSDRDFGDFTGVEWVDPAPVSATTDQQVARVYSPVCVARLHICRGVGVITLADRPHDDPASEILIEAGARYQVTAERVSRDPGGRVLGHEVDVEVTANTEDDQDPGGYDGQPVAGWYEDPEYEDHLRWWSGTNWTGLPTLPEHCLVTDDIDPWST